MAQLDGQIIGHRKQLPCCQSNTTVSSNTHGGNSKLMSHLNNRYGIVENSIKFLGVCVDRQITRKDHSTYI